MAKRLLGLDFGDKTVGVAVSDPLNMTAQGLTIIRRPKPTKLRQTLAQICDIISEYQIGTIVLGYPVNMDGSEGERCEKTRAFADELLKRADLPLVYIDERLTTVVSEKTMEETGQTDRKRYVDEIAAMLILQTYIDQEQAKAGESGL